MRDEYTKLIEEERQIDASIEDLQRRRKDVARKIIAIRDQVASSQAGRCAYCAAHLLTSAAYRAHQAWLDDAFDVGQLGGAVPYESRVKYQIRLKVPKSRGGSEVIENLVACCARCGRKKHSKTDDEFRRQIARGGCGRLWPRSRCREASATPSGVS